MKKQVKLFILGAMLSGLLLPASANAYEVEHRGNINAGWVPTTGQYIIAHDTANLDAGIDNEANNMLNNWQRQEAFTQYVVGGGGRDIQEAENEHVTRGARNANP